MNATNSWPIRVAIAMCVGFVGSGRCEAQFTGFTEPIPLAPYSGVVCATTGFSTAYRGDYNCGVEGSGSHPAVDITNDRNGQRLDTSSQVHAIYGGTIVRKTLQAIAKGNGWGNMLVIRHVGIPDAPGGIAYSAYAHLDRFTNNPSSGKEWAVGDTISKGVVLGYVGKTGNVIGKNPVHLHFQLDVGFTDYPLHPFWPNRYAGTDDGVKEVNTPDADNLVAVHTLDSVQFVVAHERAPAQLVARDDSYTLTEGGTLQKPAPGVLANDTFPSNQSVTVAFVNFPQNVINTGGGSFIFSPPLNFVGQVQFTYQIQSGGLTSNVATVTINVTAPSPVISGTNPVIPTAGPNDQPVDVSGNGFECQNPNDPANCLSLEVSAGGVLLGTLKAPGQVQIVTNSSFRMNVTFASPGTYSLVAVNPNGGRSASFNVSVQPAPPNLSWPMAGHDPARTGTSQFAGPSDLKTVSKIVLPLGGQTIAAPPVIGNGAIYVGATIGSGSGPEYLYAFDESGSILPGWPFQGPTFSFSGAGAIAWPAIAPDGTIYVLFNASIHEVLLYALRPDGTQKWATPTLIPGGPGAFPVVRQDGSVIIASSYIFSIDANGGAQWQAPIAPRGAPAVGSDGSIFSAVNSGPASFAKVSSTGVVQWAQTFGGTPAAFSAPAIGSDGTVYVVETVAQSWLVTLLGLDPATGAIRFQRSLPTANPVAGDFFQGSGDHPAPAVAPDGSIVVVTNGEQLAGFSPDLSTPRFKYSFAPYTPTGLTAPVIGADGAIYLALGAPPTGGPGAVIALNSDGSLRPSFVGSATQYGTANGGGALESGRLLWSGEGAGDEPRTLYVFGSPLLQSGPAVVPPFAGFTMSALGASKYNGETFNVWAPPNQTVTVNLASPICSGLPVGCSGDSDGPSGSGNIAAWSWNISSKGSYSTSTISVPFDVGTYSVTLTVTDSQGLQSTLATATIVVSSALIYEDPGSLIGYGTPLIADDGSLYLPRTVYGFGCGGGVCDQTLQKLQPNGTGWIQDLLSSDSEAPMGLAFGPDGRVYVEGQRWTLYAYHPDGQAVSAWPVTVADHNNNGIFRTMFVDSDTGFVHLSVGVTFVGQVPVVVTFKPDGSVAWSLSPDSPDLFRGPGDDVYVHLGDFLRLDRTTAVEQCRTGSLPVVPFFRIGTPLGRVRRRKPQPDLRVGW